MCNLTRREREKQIREEEIIKAAEIIFCEKGFEEASMEEIAKAAEFTKRTLYKYFKNKEDLYFTVALNCLKKLNIYLQKEALNEDTVIGKMEVFFKGFYKFYREQPEMLRLIGYLGHVRKKSSENSKNQKEVMQFNNEIFGEIAKVITEGKEEGTINPELDAKKTACSLIFLMTSFFNQLSITGETFLETFSLEHEDFSNSTMELLLRGIKGGNTRIIKGE